MNRQQLIKEIEVTQFDLKARCSQFSGIPNNSRLEYR